jgi:xyloglucan-specific exo-beta-1,4-glucanase
VRSISPLALLFCLACSSIAVHAQQTAETSYVWRNARVGGGGFSPGLVFSRAERDLAYLRTDIGGLYRWDKQLNRWIALQDHMPQSNYFGIESVAPDPRDANVVYAAAGMYRREPAAIIRSADRGATWEIFPTEFRMGGNEDGRGLGERLAVDPNEPSTLYFGSRHDGLQRSRDHGRTWTKVDSFPHAGLGLPASGPTHAGLSFVVFDPASAARGEPTRTIYVGIADPTHTHLYRTLDAGKRWEPVPNQPDAKWLPAQAQLDSRGILYITYATSIGPNGILDGTVFRLDTHTGEWRDITPDRSASKPPGGYMGLSIDRQRLGTLVVATVNRWQPGDTLWRSRDDGEHWTSLSELSDRDVSATPFLTWGEPHAEFGHWMSGVAIDPFDSSHMAYTTGATVHATRELLAADENKRVLWRPWVDGVEETAIITLTSPPLGPPLLSGFGDISGFVHDRLDRSPTMMHLHPAFTNTVFLDYANQAPNVVVRGGRARLPRGVDRSNAVTLAWSQDFGRTWSPLRIPAQDGHRLDINGDTPIAVSADGTTFIAMTPMPLVTRDRGATWQRAEGLSRGSRVIADRNDASRWYAMDFEDRRVLESTNGAASFTTRSTTGLPMDIRDARPSNPERPWPLLSTPGRTGDLWLVAKQGLFRSRDGGGSFEHVANDVVVEALAFGKSPAGKEYPALFAIGTRGTLRAIWRSDDEARTWIRVNDDRHEYGRRFRVIAGDPRVFGRVFVGTDGRGIVYGAPVGAPADR